jgi:NAD(P)-dependent dehydrogenase (short-subunit alcohol dehydrogenase family)
MAGIAHQGSIVQCFERSLEALPRHLRRRRKYLLSNFLSEPPSKFLTDCGQIKGSVDINIVAPFAFAQHVITAFKANDLNEDGKRGTLIFTGATASVRGNVTTSAFSAGKHGLRALSQSLAKEFGKSNIHVAHVSVFSDHFTLFRF